MTEFLALQRWRLMTSESQTSNLSGLFFSLFRTYSTHRQSLCQRGLSKEDPGMTPWHGLRCCSEEDGKTFMDNLLQGPWLQGSCQPQWSCCCGQKPQNCFGKCFLKKRGCGLTYLLLRECISLQPKSFLRGHWGIRVITQWCCSHCSWPLVCEF